MGGGELSAPRSVERRAVQAPEQPDGNPFRPAPPARTDLGLLVLRGAALLLALTFGRQKLWDLVHLVLAGAPLASSGLAPLIRAMGFPAPALLAVYVALNESVGALLVAAGWRTRLAAASLAAGMAGALYTSLRLGEEPLRAALYCLLFAVLALTGPGRLAIDSWLRSAQSARSARAPRLDAGLLLLRLGLGASFILLFALRQAAAGATFATLPGREWPLATLAVCASLVTLGLLTRLAAGAAALGWAWALISGLQAGQEWFSLPVRAALYLLLFGALAATGAGRFALDRKLRGRRRPKAPLEYGARGAEAREARWRRSIFH